MVYYPKVKVCAAHVAPVFLDAQATVAKGCEPDRRSSWRRRAAHRLSGILRARIPGLGGRAGAHQEPRLFQEAGRELDRGAGPRSRRSFARLRARTASWSRSESARRSPVSVGCLWNSNLLIGADGVLLNHHRKLVPTFYEKLIWANGDGAGLKVCETAIGKLGMLICGENTNPLARYALIAQGEQVHVSSYPPVWPTRPLNQPGRYDLARAIRIRAGAHSFEGKVFNIVASAFLDTATLKRCGGIEPEARETLEQSPQAVSMVHRAVGRGHQRDAVRRRGLALPGRSISLHCVEPKQFHDVVGYYNRFDVFDLEVNRKRLTPISLAEGREPGAG